MLEYGLAQRLKLLLADHVGDFDAFQSCRGGFEALHLSCQLLDETVVLLDNVVEIFGLNDPDDPANSRVSEDNIENLQASQIGTTFVNGDCDGGCHLYQLHT